MTGQPRVGAPAETTGNIIRDSALGHAPELLDRYMALNQDLWMAGPMSAADLEVARLRNARKVNCVYCKNIRYDIAKDAGLSEEKVAMIDDDFQDSELSEREKLILAYTDQYLNDPAGLSDDLKGELSSMFSSEELVHLSMAIVMFNVFSRFAVSMGGMPDQLPVMEISVPQ